MSNLPRIDDVKLNKILDVYKELVEKHAALKKSCEIYDPYTDSQYNRLRDHLQKIHRTIIDMEYELDRLKRLQAE